MQVSVALRRTTFISEDKLQQLLIGLNEKWIEEFSVYAFDHNNLCRAQLVLIMDWKEHTAQLNLGHDDVTINQKWENNTAIELDESIRLFNGYVNSESLWTEWRVTYTEAVRSNPALLDLVRRTLGTHAGDTITWAGKREGHDYVIPELSEMKVGCYIIP